MSLTPTDDAEKDQLEVPERVLRGIEDLEVGDTASKEDLDSVLK